MAISPQDIALAIEGINRIPDLSPLARRLCHELIGRTDRKRGACFPSEARLAASLGCDERSIRRAKVELRARGLLSWQDRGRHKTSLYRVAFAVIADLARAIKRRIRQACEPLAAKARAVKQTAENQAQRPYRPSSSKPSYSGRTFSSAYPSQLKNINRAFEGRKGFSVGASPKIDPAQAHKNAEKRFWADLAKLPSDTFIALTAAMTAEQQESAVAAEQRRFGSGVTFILEALRSKGAYEGVAA